MFLLSLEKWKVCHDFITDGKFIWYEFMAWIHLVWMEWQGEPLKESLIRDLTTSILPNIIYSNVNTGTVFIMTLYWGLGKMWFLLLLCLASPRELVFLSLMLKLLCIWYQFTPLANVPKWFDHYAKMIIVISLINFLVGVKNIINLITVFK